MQSVVFLLLGVLSLWKGNNAIAPHIVLVFVDDLGYNDVSWHNSQVQMSNISDLATNSVILEQAYAQEVCTPSRAALLTGYYPIRIGMQEDVVTATQTNGLPLSLKLLPEHLNDHGYESYMIGKWHLGFCNVDYTPLGRGFLHHYGFYNGHLSYYDHEADEKSESAIDYRNDTAVNTAANGIYATTDFTNAAIERIENHDLNKPMFLYMAYNAPHSPFEVDSSYSDLYTQFRGGNRKLYLGMITALDHQIKRLVNSLESRGMWNNTVFVFYSDNGGAVKRSGQSGNNYPLRGKKSTLWEGGYRVPAFVNSPLLSNTGYVHNGLFHVTDLFATLIYLASGKNASAIPTDIDGKNVWEAISDNSPSPRTEVVYNIVTKALSSKPKSKVVPQAAIRFNDLKLIEGDPGGFGGLDDWTKPPENNTDVIGSINNYGPYDEAGTDYYLFNLSVDPYETNNIASSDPANFALMKTKLQTAKGLAVQAITSDTSVDGLPSNNGGIWGPGFC